MSEFAVDDEVPADSARPRPTRRVWNFTPALPLRQAPYFESPFNLRGSLRYLLDIWKPFNQRFLLLLLAIAAWTWFTPSLERTREFGLDWMLEIALRHENAWLGIHGQSVTHLDRMIRATGGERMLFGSDWPFYHLGTSLAKVLITTEDPARREIRAAILRENAVRLLG